MLAHLDLFLLSVPIRVPLQKNKKNKHMKFPVHSQQPHFHPQNKKNIKNYINIYTTIYKYIESMMKYNNKMADK